MRWCPASVVLALAISGTARAGVVINELLPDPAGADAGFEWVELLNTGPSAVDISGWELEAGLSSFSSKHVFAALILQPGDRLWVGEASVVGVDVVTGVLSLGNAGASGDGIRLVDSVGGVMDTVIYGPNNSDGFLDDSGGVAVSIAPSPISAESLSRLPDGADTDLSAADFVSAAVPTPDASNDPAGCDVAGVWINELEADPAGADADFEWVELYNPGGSDVDVSGWILESGTSTFSSSGVLPAGTIVPAGGFLVIGQTAIPEADVVAAGFDLGNASGSSDAVRLLACDFSTVDTVVYGTPNTDLWLDDTGAVAVSLAADADEPSTIGRATDGVDSDLSGTDFVTLPTPSPGAANAAVIDTGADTGLPAGCDVGGVVLNEIEADPSGADGVLEWVELYNPGVADVDVSGWTVEGGASSFSTSGVIPGGTLVPAGGFLVVGQSAIPEADVVAAGFVLSNASGSSDAVRLVACEGTPVDTVVYGTPNTDSWLDDTGVVAVSLAADADEADTLGRIVDGVDSDLSGADFAAQGPTPGATNGVVITPGSCDDAVAGAAVVINEFIPDPAGADAGLEWVELHNPGGTSVDISSWVIAAGTSSFSGSGTLPEGTILAPGAFLVVGQAAIPEADVVADGWDLGNAGSNSDGVRLEDCGGGVVDTVIYGSPNTDAWTDDTLAVATSLGPKAGSAESVARVTDGFDTDACGVDFELAAFPSPGSSNDAPVVDCGGTGSGVTINEFLYDPDGSDGGLEFVELFHAGGAVVDLSGWAIQTATSSYSDAFTFPDGTSLGPGEILLIGESLVPGADFVAELGMGNASSSADGVRLVDCSGFPADTVVYGDTNTDGLIDDSLAPATSLAPGVSGGSSLQRIEDGYDTDQSAVDFAEAELPTPGASNPVLEPVICVPSDGSVVLNEFVPNPASSDTSAEWVELYNAGTTSADLSGWGIDMATSSWSTEPDVVLPGGTILEAGGFLVVGGALSPATINAEFSLGNASSNADGLRLLDCVGTVVDTAIYGEANPDGLLDDAGGIVPSAVPGEAGSLARDPDGFDTNAPTDWVIRGAPTPGESNFFDPGALGAEEPRGCGCGGAPDDGAPAPGGGCATDPVRSYALWGAAGMALVLRRRQRRM